MIAKCPKCGEFVQAPARVAPTVRVRCVLCHEEYVLADALALAPPTLTLVETPTADEPAMQATAAQDEDSSKEEYGSVDVEHHGIPVGERRYPSISELTRPRHNPKSTLQTLVEVVSGGLAGCLAAYYILAFWFGPRFNEIGLPRLPLPFISQMTTPAEPCKSDSSDSKAPSSVPNNPPSRPSLLKYQCEPESALAVGDKTAYSSGRSFRVQTIWAADTTQQFQWVGTFVPFNGYDVCCLPLPPDHHS